MFYMLYMVISLKSKLARLKARWFSLGIEKLKRKRLFGGDNSLRAVGRNKRFDRAICVGEPKRRPARLKLNRSRCGESERRRCRKNGRL